MCTVLQNAFEDRVLSFVVSWCCGATRRQMDDLARKLREACSVGQQHKLADVFEQMAWRLSA